MSKYEHLILPALFPPASLAVFSTQQMATPASQWLRPKSWSHAWPWHSSFISHPHPKQQQTQQKTTISFLLSNSTTTNRFKVLSPVIGIIAVDPSWPLVFWRLPFIQFSTQELVFKPKSNHVLYLHFELSNCFPPFPKEKAKSSWRAYEAFYEVLLSFPLDFSTCFSSFTHSVLVILAALMYFIHARPAPTVGSLLELLPSPVALCP